MRHIQPALFVSFVRSFRAKPFYAMSNSFVLSQSTQSTIWEEGHMFVHRTAYLRMGLRLWVIYWILEFHIIYQNRSLEKDTNTFYLHITSHIENVLQTCLHYLCLVFSILTLEVEKIQRAVIFWWPHRFIPYHRPWIESYDYKSHVNSFKVNIQKHIASVSLRWK